MRHVEVDAVVDSAGDSHEVDAVVLATGFKAVDYLGEIEVSGFDGITLSKAWNGEPEAFLGMTVPGFPNFYMMYGPNTNLGAVTFMLETQADYIAREIRSLRRDGGTREVRLHAHRVYNTWLQARLKRTVWATTDSYFKTASGKLVVTFPTAPVFYWAMSRILRWVTTRSRPRPGPGQF